MTTSPWRQVTFARFFSRAMRSARASMAGVMSMPVACFTTVAKAQTTLPPPQATSSTVSFGPAPLASSSNCSAFSSAMVLAVEKGTACLLNWSTIKS